MSATTYGWLVLAFPLAGMVVISLGWRVLPGRLPGWIATSAIFLAFLSSIGALIDLQDHPEEERHLECATSRRGQRRQDPIELRLEQNGVRAVALADEDKLRQVLVNLLDNAIKYSPDGGDITVELAGGAGRVRLTVRDRRLGSPASEHERIFEKFYRLDPDLTRGVGGTGLGLYISRELLERMGGRIWVESSGSGGSTFVAELPVAA